MGLRCANFHEFSKLKESKLWLHIECPLPVIIRHILKHSIMNEIMFRHYGMGHLNCTRKFSHSDRRIIVTRESSNTANETGRSNVWDSTWWKDLLKISQRICSLFNGLQNIKHWIFFHNSFYRPQISPIINFKTLEVYNSYTEVIYPNKNTSPFLFT